MRDTYMLFVDSLKKLKAKNPKFFYLIVASAIFLVIYSLYMLLCGLNNGLNFEGYAADGSFQIYNPLRRMAAGQVPGRDFQFFHGIGIPLLLFPLFKLLGANLFASEVTRWIMTLVMYAVPSFIFFKVFLKSWYKAGIGLALSLLLTLLVADTITPGNSMMGLRIAMPFLLAASLLAGRRWSRTVWHWQLPLNYLLEIGILAVGFMLSTEQGLYTILAYFVWRIILTYRDHHFALSAYLKVALQAIALIGLILALFSIATLGHPLRPLIYALKTVPAEQFWYFGVPPNTFLSWHNLPRIAFHMYRLYIPLIVLWVVFREAKKRAILTSIQLRTLLFLTLYSLFSFGSALGYISLSQFFPLLKVVVTVFVGLMLLLADYKAPRNKRVLAFNPRLVNVLYAGACLLLVGYSVATLYRINRFHLINIVKRAPAAHHEPDQDFVTAGWASALGTFSQLDSVKQGQVWSTYSSLYESSHGIFNPSNQAFDYIIHALGPKNFSAYVQQFSQQKPKYAITMRPNYFIYEQWLWTSNWPFYRELLSHYTVTSYNASHFLWQYTGDISSHNGPWKTTKLSDNAFHLPTVTAPTLYEVTVHYDAKTPLNKLRALPRYLIKPTQTGLSYDVAVPQYATSWSFVVPVYPGDTKPTLQGYADGLIPGAKLQLNSVQYHTLAVPSANLQPFFDNNLCTKPTSDGINIVYVPCKSITTHP